MNKIGNEPFGSVGEAQIAYSNLSKTQKAKAVRSGKFRFFGLMVKSVWLGNS